MGGDHYIEDVDCGYGLRCRLARLFIRWVLRPRLSARHDFATQRRAVERIAALRWMPSGVRVEARRIAGVACEHHRLEHSAGVLLFLHGGAFVLGSPATHRELAARLALAAGLEAVVPAYRLAPEHPYPAALEDVLAVYRALCAEAGAPAQIAVAGDSAGGCLAALLCQRLAAAGERQPAALCLLSPATDLTGSGESMRTHVHRDPMITPGWVNQAIPTWHGDVSPASPEVSPLFGDCAGLPATLIQVGSEEMLLSDAERFAARLHAAGVAVRLERWQHLWHDFQMLADWLPPARAALARAGAFLRHRLGPVTGPAP